MSQPRVVAPDWPDPENRPEPDALDPATIARLAEEDGPADLDGAWPESLWKIVLESGATRWLLPRRFGGDECDRGELVLRYARLAEGSLTAAFILTQHDAAVRRLVPASQSGNAAADRWLEGIGNGTAFATVGISQLTTSRRKGSRALLARPNEDGGFTLDGSMPWVTAAPRADILVTGAVTETGLQLLIALPTDRRGLTVQPPFNLAAVQASCTCEVTCEGVSVEPSDILAGPVTNVMESPGQAGTGGLETSALALGQARAALVALVSEAERREDPIEPVEALNAAWQSLASDLLNAAAGDPLAPSPGSIRSRANSLVLRATQAYLTARKGTGFLRSEPAQRWARQALFFLVWSCPTPVAQASIRDLAGLCFP